MRFVETHRFADKQFVSEGFTHFAWTVSNDTVLPVFHENYGVAVVLSDDQAGPEVFARYNPETKEFVSPLSTTTVSQYVVPVRRQRL